MSVDIKAIRSRVNTAISLVDDALVENRDFRRSISEATLESRLANIFATTCETPSSLVWCDCEKIPCEDGISPRECVVDTPQKLFDGFAVYDVDKPYKNAHKFPDLYEIPGYTGDIWEGIQTWQICTEDQAVLR